MRQLILSIGLMYLILILVNVPAPWLGLKFESSDASRRLWFEPPGYLIPIVWFVLFTLMGIARARLADVDASTMRWWIDGLAVLCAAYAYYTLGLSRLTGVSPLWFGLWGNLVVIVAALWVARRIGMADAAGGWLILPVALWTAYATAIVLGKLQAGGANASG